MTRSFCIRSLVMASGLLSGVTIAVAGDASTVRIEPRPFYGATITLEAGVRVFRPLPAPKYVVINPDNKTPLALSLSEVNETRHSYNYNYQDSSERSSGDNVGGYPYIGGIGHPGTKSTRGSAQYPVGGHHTGGGGHGGGRGGHSGGGFGR